MSNTKFLHVVHIIYMYVYSYIFVNTLLYRICTLSGQFFVRPEWLENAYLNEFFSMHTSVRSVECRMVFGKERYDLPFKGGGRRSKGVAQQFSHSRVTMIESAQC